MSIGSNKRGQITAHIFFSFLIAIILGVIAGNQYFGESRDYSNYADFFNALLTAPNLSDVETRFEPGFTLLSYWLTALGFGAVATYSFIAGFCVLIKAGALRTSEASLVGVFMFVLFYFARYFILFEMTVLRAAVAFSIAFFVFFRKRDERVHIFELSLLLLATAFHYSAVIFLFIYSQRQLSPWRAIAAALFVFLMGVVAKEFIFERVEEILPVFSSYRDVGVTATVLPIPYILDILLAMFGLYFWKYNDVPMKYSVLGIIVGAAIHFSMLDYTIIAGRFRELMSVFILVYVVRAAMSSCRFLRVVAIMFTTVSGSLYFYAMTIYDPLLS
ncbi:hypothetical protein R82526_01086 [Ralstonia mannitolilytica]|uniref:EpsG family protein n=1 Tax=Ralstonia mannitolilytica TaxID=105219 RepID=UPI0028F64BB4|nr:EpsG family protein [Ralstonia mannitolilytica]CAJ0681142.1 hypothetical protein R82526_01086 [Ralstonia mannitolilytica]